MNLPKHVAIIMDGNGRWAQLRGRPRVFGHIRGSSMVRPLVRESGRLGLQYLTLYAFSSENWGRPSAEVGVLMRLLRKYLVREQNTLMKNNVRFNTIGETSRLPKEVQEVLAQTIELTSKNTGLVLTFALSYGSRQEILRAVQEVATKVKSGALATEQITGDILSQHLDTAGMPDPDLIIRSSGEMRLSNFMLWQAAYSELYVTDTLWPDFTLDEFHKALETFSRRKRRFGLTDDQLKNSKQTSNNQKGALQ